MLNRRKIMERTFVALKPDTVKRCLVGEIISRFERKGYKIIGMKLIQPTEELIEKHYAEHIGKPFYPDLVKYFLSGPIVAMVIAGENIIHGVRQIVGATNPDNADVGTIRADYAQIMRQNIVHASDSIESAEREINVWFTPEEIHDDWKTIAEMLIESI